MPRRQTRGLREAALGRRELSPEERQLYGIEEGERPTIRDVMRYQEGARYDPVGGDPARDPVPSPEDEAMQQQYKSPTQRKVFERTGYQPQMPEPEMMTLDEMMDIAERRAKLATQPQVEALERGLEEQELEAEQYMGEVERAYDQQRARLQEQQHRDQAAGAETMDRRGTYDAGLAHDLSARIAQDAAHRGQQLAREEAETLADIAEYLNLQQRQTREEIHQIMGERAEMAEQMLNETRMHQQDRRDQLAQQEFENWLTLQGQKLQEDQLRLDEYWREQEFDARQAQQEYEQWLAEEQLRQQEFQAKWDRIMAMNQFEAEQELQRLAMDNEITQQEFEWALALDEFDLKRQLYEWESQLPR